MMEGTRITCDECGTAFHRLFGMVDEDGAPAGAYTLDLHVKPLCALLAMITDDAAGRPTQVVAELRVVEGRPELMLRDTPADPFYRRGFVFERGGRALDRAAALVDPLKETFFHMSDHIVLEDSRLRAHLGLDKKKDA